MIRLLVTLLVLAATAAWTGHGTTAQRADNLDGTWEIVSVIDDGQIIWPGTIKETLVKDARLTIQQQVIRFTRADGKAQVRVFTTDATSSPRSFDLGGAEKFGSKGIYQLDGDSLVLCLSGEERQPRPTSFASRYGQDTVLFTLRRVAAALPPPRDPPPVAPPAPPAPPRNSDEELRRMLVGTWGHQDDKVIQRGSLNADGTFSATQEYKRGMKKVFDAEERLSGRWAVKDGQVTMTVTAGADRANMGQVHSYTVKSITQSEVIFVNNQTGARRVEWRIR